MSLKMTYNIENGEQPRQKGSFKMTEQIKKYVMTVCYNDKEEFYTSDDFSELENLYKFSKRFKKGCTGCNVRNAKGKLLFGYVGANKFE